MNKMLEQIPTPRTETKRPLHRSSLSIPTDGPRRHWLWWQVITVSRRIQAQPLTSREDGTVFIAGTIGAAEAAAEAHQGHC